MTNHQDNFPLLLSSLLLVRLSCPLYYWSGSPVLSTFGQALLSSILLVRLSCPLYYSIGPALRDVPELKHIKLGSGFKHVLYLQLSTFCEAISIQKSKLGPSKKSETCMYIQCVSSCCYPNFWKGKGKRFSHTYFTLW